MPTSLSRRSSSFRSRLKVHRVQPLYERTSNVLRVSCKEVSIMKDVVNGASTTLNANRARSFSPPVVRTFTMEIKRHVCNVFRTLSIGYRDFEF